MNRLLPLLLALGFALNAAPAEAQLGRLVDRARSAAGRTADQAAGHAADAGTNAATPGRAEVVEAARHLVAAYDAYEPSFRNPSTQAFSYDHIQHAWPNEGEAWLATVEAVEANYPAMQAPMAVLAAHFGPEWHEVDAGMTRMGVDATEYGGGTSVGHAYKALQEGMTAVRQFRRDVAAGAVSSARPTMDAIEDRFYMPEIRVQKAQELKAALQLAQRLDAQNADLNAMLASIDAYIDEVHADVQAEIDAGEWPGHAAGAPTALAGDVLAFFRAHEEWGGQPEVEVLAVSVLGDWASAEHNLLGEVIQWRLPVAVAATKPIWQASSAARVYELSVLAQQSNPAPQAPPFVGYWVGHSHLVRLDKLPAQ